MKAVRPSDLSRRAGRAADGLLAGSDASIRPPAAVVPAAPVWLRPVAREVGRSILVGLLVALAVLLPARAGVTAGAGGPVEALPLLVVLALLVIAAAALVRFEVVALAMVAGRAALDLSHQGGGALLRPSVLVTLGFSAMAVLWLIGRIDRGVLQLSPLAWSLVALTAAASLSAMFADRQMAALEGATRFGVLVVMVVAFEHLARDKPVQRRLYLASATGAVVPLAVGAGQALGGATRIEGSFSHPNTYGFFLVITLLMGLAVVNCFRWPIRALVYGGLLVAVAQLILTFSRSSYLALFVGLVAIAVASRRWWVLPILGLVVAAAFSVPAVQQRFADLDQERTLRGTAGNSLVWRMDYWAQLVALAEDRPATGIGSTAIQEETASGKPAHNDWVKAFVETGIIGTMAYAALSVLLGVTAWRAVRRSRDRWERSVGLGVSGCVAAFWVSSLASNVIQQLVSLWYFFAFAALASAVAWRPRDGDGAAAAATASTAGTRTSDVHDG